MRSLQEKVLTEKDKEILKLKQEVSNPKRVNKEMEKEY